jgi:hypothetical protein
MGSLSSIASSRSFTPTPAHVKAQVTHNLAVFVRQLLHLQVQVRHKDEAQ